MLRVFLTNMRCLNKSHFLRQQRSIFFPLFILALFWYWYNYLSKSGRFCSSYGKFNFSLKLIHVAGNFYYHNPALDDFDFSKYKAALKAKVTSLKTQTTWFVVVIYQVVDLIFTSSKIVAYGRSFKDCNDNTYNEMGKIQIKIYLRASVNLLYL